MENNILTGLDQIHELLDRCPPSRDESGWWFRGQANYDWPLIPKAGRPEFFLPVSPREKPIDLSPPDGYYERYRRWKKQAIAYHPNLPQSEQECLAIAQHHGLATSLLDWTSNVLIAAFFATWEHASSEGCIYCISPFKEPKFQVNLKPTGSVRVYIPPALSPRILNQAGAFTQHTPPNLDLLSATDEQTHHKIEIMRFKIPANSKTKIQTQLNQFGVSRSTLFPDLDGLSAQINAETSRLVAENAATNPA